MDIRTIRLGIFALVSSASTIAVSGPSEMNIRQSGDNANMNKISQARIRAMLVDQSAQKIINDLESSDDDCGVYIGNSTAGISLLEDKRDIIVVGTINNVCKR